MEMPFIGRLQTRDRSMLAIVRTVRADDANVQAMGVAIFAQRLADLLTSPFFTLLPRADVKNSRRSICVLAHRSSMGRDSPAI